MVARPCLDCGRVTRAGSRCPPCGEQYQVRRDRARGTRTERGYDNDWLRISKQAIKDQPWCSWCLSTEDLTGDHIVPLSKGGTNTRENCRVLCRGCNSKRGAA